MMDRYIGSWPRIRSDSGAMATFRVTSHMSDDARSKKVRLFELDRRRSTVAVESAQLGEIAEALPVAVCGQRSRGHMGDHVTLVMAFDWRRTRPDWR